MTLKYDTSGMKYVTQEAYGTTWELQSTDTDGCQVWRNAAGQQAVVPRVTSQDPVTNPCKEVSLGRGNSYELLGFDEVVNFDESHAELWKKVTATYVHAFLRTNYSIDVAGCFKKHYKGEWLP